MKKRLAVLLSVVMIFSLIPLTGSAASTNNVDRVLTVARNANLATMSTTPILTIVDRDNSFSGQDETFRLVLPGTATWINPEVSVGVGSTLINESQINPQTLQITANLVEGSTISVVLNVQLNDALGEQRVTVDRRDSALSGDSHTFAIAEVGETITLVSRDNLYEGDFAEVGSLIIEETVKGTVTGNQQFRLRLPVNFEWNPVHETPANIALEGFLYDETDDEAELTVAISNSNRDMTITFVAEEGPSLPGSIRIIPSIRARQNAAFGEVAVSLTGQNDISNATDLVIADYRKATYTIESDTEDDEFVTGRSDGYTASINIKESVADTLIKSRYIDVELPSWVRIVNGTNVRVNSNNVAQGGTDTTSFRFLLLPNVSWMDDDVFDFNIDFEFVISGIAALDGPVDIPVTLTGAGINDEVSIGTAMAAIMLEVEDVETTYLQAGLQSQPAPEILITENFPGALQTGELRFEAIDVFAGSVRIDSFEVEVVEGDIVLGAAETDMNAFWVDVTGDSESASVIRLYDIEVTLDGTVPVGTLVLDVLGDAVLDLENFSLHNLPERVFRIDPYAMIGQPPAEPTTAVAFTIGTNAYTVNGLLRSMEVAPYIQNDRMMIPVRYLEDLFGAKPEWNPDTRSVSIEYGGQIFEMTIGSTTLTADGEPIMQLDVSAEITGDRTFVPASRFARAMGVTYLYDADTRTATFN